MTLLWLLRLLAKVYQLEMRKYLKNEKISVKQARLMFKFRTRMIQCWGNFKGGRPPQKCPICEDPSSTDDQEHIMQRKALTYIIKEERLFGTLVFKFATVKGKVM